MISFYDTSALLGNAPINENTFISTVVLDELEHIKTDKTKDDNTKYKARHLVRAIMLNKDIKHHIFPEKDIQKLMKKYDFLAVKNDSRIICEALLLAKTDNVKFITRDACQYLIVVEHFPQLHAEYWGDGEEKKQLWDGYVQRFLTDDEMSYMYSNPDKNTQLLSVNEYAMIYSINNLDEVVDIVKWDGTTTGVIKYNKIHSDYFGNIGPRNPQQEMAFDLFQNRNITIKSIRGTWGSGKTMLAFTHAIEMLQRGTIRKIVLIRNNIEVSGSQEIGALPGSEFDKLRPYVMPFVDHLGSEEVLQEYISQGMIEPVHVGFLRGRNFSDCVVIVDEAENITSEIATLIVSRAAENCQIWFLSDETQTDKDIFKRNGGITHLCARLKGNPLFGAIRLPKTERSATAELSSLLK